MRLPSGILDQLGVTLHGEKTRIVHVRKGFEFLGYKIKRGQRPLRLSAEKIRSGVRHGDLYAFPRAKSIQHFKDQIRRRTRRKAPVSTRELIEQINPVIRGWGLYFCKAHVRRLFNRLDRWIVRRLWSHRFRRWRNAGWKRLPERRLYGDFGLVKLIALIPSLNLRVRHLCESGLRENCTSRLCGGRRRAPRGASSDPTSGMNRTIRLASGRR